MMYKSTRDTKNSTLKTSAEVIKQGIAEDGGLFMPERIPQIDLGFIESLTGLSYVERAAKVLSLYLEDYTHDELLRAASDAYSEEKFPGGAAPLAALGDTHRILELWHGPTCAFKDMALQIMPRLLSEALTKTGEKRTAFILVATSGDTGKAALEGYADAPKIKIMVFYPEDGVSAMQKLQMTSQKGDNVYVCAIKGNFDDAQSGVKKIFSDEKTARELDGMGYFLSSANSINWGRLVPQIVYYISAYCDMAAAEDIKLGDEIDVTVPTGNFGNIFAAYLAKRMGLPIRRLICASNSNNILTDFIKTGVYDRNRAFHTTMSPSMDILISSNLERLLYTIAGAEKTAEWMKSLSETGRYEVDSETFAEIKSVFAAEYCSEENTAATIKNTFDKYSYLIDTHTAVGLYCAEKCDLHDGVKMLTASTASAYKFAADVLKSLGVPESEIPEGFGVVRKLSEVTSTEIPAPLAALEGAKIRFTGSVGKTYSDMWDEAKKFLGK